MEPITQTSIISIQDSTQVAVARRAASRLAEYAGLDENRVSAVNISTVELANNLLQHANGGEIYLQYQPQTGVIDIAAVDRGPGIANIDLCLTDGYSTASTPGLGLGAVHRFATRFDTFSIPNRITVVAARMAENLPLPDFSVISTAIHGETLSGDSWSVSPSGDTFLVVDGLGHGMFASEAAAAAVAVFGQYSDLAPGALMERMHGALRSTRGAAAAVATIDRSSRRIRFAGIGNISASVLRPGGSSQSFVSHNGTLGHQMRRVQEFEYPYEAGSFLLMHSDGLSANQRSGLPPSLFQHSPSVIAPLLYSEQVRGRDDATILVNRIA